MMGGASRHDLGCPVLAGGDGFCTCDEPDEPGLPLTTGDGNVAAVEALAAEFHAIYQAEAKRQGDVRHHDDYDALSENVKEFDRVLAREVIRREAELREQLDAARQAQTFHIYWCPICEVQTERPWHSFRDGGLIPQNDTEHQCERIEVVARAALGVEAAMREQEA